MLIMEFAKQLVYAVIIGIIANVLADLAVTLIGVFSAWLMAQIKKIKQRNTINMAVKQLTEAAETTALELEQTVVDGMKTSSSDGKLTQEEAIQLEKLLLEGTLAKLPDSDISVLKVANVDIHAIVSGVGEVMIARMKQKEQSYG